VQGDRRERGGLRRRQVSTGFLAHPPREPGDDRAQAMGEVRGGDVSHR
jgi:hypothetical protein